MIATLRLPFPPSVNSMYLNAPGRGRVKSPEYREWLECAAWELLAQKIERVKDRCIVNIDLDDTRRGDADNRIKPVLDLLVQHGVLPGDSKKFVQRSSAGWETLTGCRVRIEAA